jgi:hypothetical protein
MTQVSRYGHMLKMRVEGMRMHVTARYRVDGSVLNDTVQARMVGVETRLELDSPEPAERVARLVKNAERGCFVMQGLLSPVPIQSTTVLNGQPLSAKD